MQRLYTHLKTGALIAAVLLSSALTTTRLITKYSGENRSLKARWSWAITQAADLDVYWVGYRFGRLMGENSHIGSWSSRREDNEPSLSAMLGEPQPPSQEAGTLQETAKKALEEARRKHEGRKAPQVVKPVAVLLRYERHAGSPRELADVVISNTSLRVELHEKPLYWLGGSSQKESFALLQSVWDENPSNNRREDLLAAFAMHDSLSSSAEALTRISATDKSKDVRETAVFWMGQMDTPEVLADLRKLIASDPSGDVREKAVFSISQMTIEPALDVLIDLARNARDDDVREKAIFWLGERASRKAQNSLEEMVYDESSQELKEKAVFAISQQEDDIAIPTLIKIARTHPSGEIREKAIFWLGQTEDPRAVEALVELVK